MKSMELRVIAFYLNFFLFALVASITPGPTNFMSLMIGTRWGVLAAMPFILGASICAALILWLSGIGLAQVVVEQSWLKIAMGWGGALWMTWLAWNLYFAQSGERQLSETKILGWRHGAGLQLINPKTWMMALSVTGIFALPSADPLRHVSILAFIFFLVAVPCLMSWSWLGQTLRTVKNFVRKEILINRLMAFMLLVMVWSALLITGEA